MDRSRVSFSSSQWLAYAIFIVLGLALRWYALDSRPIHHDESLHAMYGIYFFDWPAEKFYRYDPMLHGPLMYNLYPLIYNTLGISDWSIRFPIAFMGSLFLFLPLLFRRYLNTITILALTGAIALSPSLTYWSRLIHHDEYVLIGMFMMLIGALLVPSRFKALMILVGFAIQYTVKANVFITAALLLGYLFYEALFNWIVVKERETTLLACWKYIKANIVPVIFGICAAIFVFCLFYTSGFRYSEGILDGLYRKGIAYWWEHHSMERIKGPFLFHFYLLSWYELPFIALFFTHMFLIYKEAGTRMQTAAAVFFALAAGLALGNSGNPQAIVDSKLWDAFKLKDAFDLFGLFIIVPHAVLVTSIHLLRGERALAFFGYFFLANFFAYSYAGEKTPWLSIYPLVSGLAYFAIYFQDYIKRHSLSIWESCSLGKGLCTIGVATFCLGMVFVLEDSFGNQWGWLASGLVIFGIGLTDSWGNFLGNFSLQRVLFAVVAVFLLRDSIMTNFTYDGEARELLSQVHTTHEFDGIIRRIRTELEAAAEEDRPEVLVTGEAVWPTVWYMRGLPLRYDKDKDLKKYKYIFQDYTEDPTKIPEGFKARKVKLRGWWVPDYSNMTFGKFLNYAVNHVPWKPQHGGDPTGYSYITMLTRQDGAN